jgi:hypothetical protein
MPEVSVFDAHRIRQALRGQLADGETVEALACDDATKDYWVVTTSDLVVMSGDTITFRLALDRLAAEGTTDAAGTTLRIQDRAANKFVIGTFRKPNRVTERILGLLD